MSAITVLSLGAGVQSTTLLLMAEHGEVDRPVEAIFADTGWEPQAVYDHLAWLRSQTSIPISTVSAGDLRADALAGEPAAWMPLYVTNRQGQGGQLRRQCTRNYKLRPIRRRVRALADRYGAATVSQQIGISLDEAIRMRTSGVAYVENVYPLIDLRMTRADCVAWLTRHDYPTPPKSACVGCPYHDAAYWRRLRGEGGAAWADAVSFDAAIRDTASRMGNPVYLHRDRVPLPDVDLTTPQDRGQLDFLHECEGMCGV